MPQKDIIETCPTTLAKTISQTHCASLEELCEITMGTDMFQLYDGSLKYAG